MEAPIFLLFALAVGYLMFWTVVNEKRDPNGGYEGWFAIRRPDSETKAQDDQRKKPWSRN